MPLVDSFPQHLREDLEIVANGDLDSVFDISRVRKQLEKTKIELQDELTRVSTFAKKIRYESCRMTANLHSSFSA